MAKDINIHLKTTGAEQTKQKLRETGKAAKGVGESTAAGHKQGAQATEQATQKMTGMGRVLSNLKSQVFAFVGAWLSIQTAQKALDYFIEKLQRIQQLQKEIYKTGLSLAEIGQALEFQTGTRGRQQYWTEQAIRLQQAGGIAMPETAQQMMVSMDIAFQRLGGIQSEQVMELAMQLAPFVGAAGAKGLGPEEVSKLFEFAGIAGIAPTEEAYKEYFAKLQAGYTASKAVDFGQFMMGLQKGGTAYMAMGGTLEEAISAFASARSVMANEALAATLVEQIARLSGGAYERPRQAIERKLGVSWPGLSMDERMDALLRYVGGIPEARRGEVLAKEGFPIELTTQIGKMVSPEAVRTMGTTREQVAEATATMIEELTQAYLDSMLAEERKTEAKIALRRAKAAPEFADWQTRINKAQAEFEDQNAKYMDRWIVDAFEPQVIAFEKMRDEIDTILKTLPEGPLRERTEELRRRLHESIIRRHGFLLTLIPKLRIPPGLGAKRGIEYTEELEAIYEALQRTPAQPSEEVVPIEEEPISKKITVPAEAAEQQIEVPVKAVAQEVPAEITEVGVPAEAAELTEIGVPVAAMGEEIQVKETPVEIHHHQIVVNHNYDSSMRFYPRFGNDERGPRFEQV